MSFYDNVTKQYPTVHIFLSIAVNKQKRLLLLPNNVLIKFDNSKCMGWGGGGVLEGGAMKVVVAIKEQGRRPIRRVGCRPNQGEVKISFPLVISYSKHNFMGIKFLY